MPITETLPPGTYYIGDIGHALSTETFLDFWGNQYGYTSGSFHVADGQFVVDKTAPGDGIFYGTDGSKFLVDAGNIGIVTRNLWDETEIRLRTLGKIIDSSFPIHVYFSEGMFQFSTPDSTLSINTQELDRCVQNCVNNTM